MNRSTSAQWFARAQAKIPGGVNSPVRSFKHVGATPVYFAHADGAYLHDVDGNRYVDFCLSFGPHLLGHSHPRIVAALTAQASKATSFGACHAGEVLLAERVLAAYPFLQKMRLVNSGTEATMTLVRLARGYTNRAKIIQFEGCYHGHSDAFLAKAGSGVAALTESSSRGVPPSVVADTLIARFDDLATVDAYFAQFPDDIAAVILEPVPANYGLWNPGRERLEHIVTIARRHGALVIFDEVITGFRLGANGACGYFGLEPDLVALGKIVGGGLPLAAIAGRAEILDLLAPSGSVYQAGTLSGNPMAVAAGLAVLDGIAVDPPYARLDAACATFVEGLRAILPPPCTVRRLGSLFWIDFAEEAAAFPPAVGEASRQRYAEFFKTALDAGVYFSPSPYEVGFISTAHTPEILADVVARLARALGA
ncbi:MAG: glutamate-1-semialdehyde 2,1-aminomutase [Burkholderiales bacterium]|nr:glutamate-1-semialdehyde 2,1-aminomutase [Burkholderiales bacterium]